MKSIAKQTKEPKPIGFPKLMTAKDSPVILASSESDTYIHGTVVYSKDGNHKLGQQSILWPKSTFSDYEGSITLQND